MGSAPRPQKPAPPPPTPSRADARLRANAQSGQEVNRGLSLITNSFTGLLARPAQTGKTITTAGTRRV